MNTCEGSWKCSFQRELAAPCEGVLVSILLRTVCIKKCPTRDVRKMRREVPAESWFLFFDLRAPGDQCSPRRVASWIARPTRSIQATARREGGPVAVSANSPRPHNHAARFEETSAAICERLLVRRSFEVQGHFSRLPEQTDRQREVKKASRLSPGRIGWSIAWSELKKRESLLTRAHWLGSKSCVKPVVLTSRKSGVRGGSKDGVRNSVSKL